MDLINGSEIAEKILDGLKSEVAALPFQPLFCDVLIGADPVSRSYVNIKRKRAEEIGLEFKLAELPEDVTTAEVIQLIEEIQSLPHLSGLIVQLPLPAGLDKKKILDAINPKFDVDCLGETNTKLFNQGEGNLVPPTAGSVMVLLDSLELDLTAKQILVIGQGDLVGKPVTHLLQQKNYRVQTADEATADLKTLTLAADVIISGTGVANLIKQDMIQAGAILIDCGTAESSGGIVGDVDTESVADKAGLVSPVPGGVGPVTVAKLLENVVRVAKQIGTNH